MKSIQPQRRNLQTSPSNHSSYVQFLGATDSVSGSMHLLDVSGYRVLLDCGNASPHEKRRRDDGARWPFDPRSIDAVCITHAHQDHCGDLPLLVRDGFSGPILCSEPTAELLEIVLYDRAQYFEKKLERASRYSRYNDRYGSRSSELEDSYSLDDVIQTLQMFQLLSMDRKYRIHRQVELQMFDSAHVLGSTALHFHIRREGGDASVLFTGDLGRAELPLVGQPPSLPPADVLICESTYGGKSHASYSETVQELATIVNQTIERGGKVLIPAFSLGRIHLVLYTLNLAREQGLLRRCPIYLDSPLSKKFDRVYHRYLHPEISERLEGDWIEDTEEAWYRSTHPDPCVMIASGGMCDGGRILEHLRYHIDDPRSSLVLVSFQAPETLGAKILSPIPTVRFHGRLWNKWIDVHQVSGLSAHADQAELLSLLQSAAPKTGSLCLVHGEKEQKTAFKTACEDLGFADVRIAGLGERLAF